MTILDRKLRVWLEKQVKTPQVAEIVGLRQVGKTTLMESFLRNLSPSLHFRFQDLVTLSQYRARPEVWSQEVDRYISTKRQSSKDSFTPGEYVHIFVDEIQKVPDLYQAIQGLYDKYKGSVKFWIWGSSARAQRRGKAETLAGRVLSRRLWPLMHSEVVASDGGERELDSCVPVLTDLDRLASMHVPRPASFEAQLARHYLTQSMLPEPYLSETTELAIELLQNYKAIYIENEIRREKLVNDISQFERFVKLAASINGSKPNMSKMARDLSISPSAVKRYYQLLLDTFMIYELPVFSTSMRVQVAKQPRYVFADTGLARIVSGMRHIPETGTDEFGRAFESWVITELRKQIDAAALPWTLHHLRTKSGRELDVVIDTPREGGIAIEVKSSARLPADATKHLKYFLANEPRITRGIVISLDPKVQRLADNIIAIPAWYL